MRKMAAFSLALVGLATGGMFAVTASLASGWQDFLYLFSPESAARRVSAFLLASALFGLGGAAFLASRATVVKAQRWSVWGLCAVLATISLLLRSSTVALWWFPLWMVFRYAASKEP
jgi:hypothetical protein